MRAPFDRPSPGAGELEAAIAAVRSGHLVVFPTETLYGLAADPISPAALARLFALKGREPHKPIALIASDTDSAFTLARHIPEEARALADQFWPGPLTLVLAARSGLHPALIGSGGGVGVRVSPHPVARQLACGAGGLITATSANLSGQPAVRNIAEARQTFGAQVSVYLDGGWLENTSPSTVVEFRQDGSWAVLRTGATDPGAIAAVLGRRK